MGATDTDKTEPGWCILELLGHRRLGGYLTETEIAGSGFLRIDVPGIDGGNSVTQFVTPASVYAITPVTQEMAEAVAKRNQPEPVPRWELPSPEVHPDHVAVVDYDKVYEPPF